MLIAFPALHLSMYKVEPWAVIMTTISGVKKRPSISFIPDVSFQISNILIITDLGEQEPKIALII